MELVVGMEQHDGQLVGRAVDHAGHVLRLLPKELATRGLPVSKQARARPVTNFGVWEEASFEEYANGLGFDLPASIAADHKVWAFEFKRNRVLIPALVLMRALFRPNSALLNYLFRPQSLESVCTFTSGEKHRVAVLAKGIQERERTQDTILEPLSWMCCYPSGRSLWSSAQLGAERGALSLDLPPAEVEFVCHGVRQGPLRVPGGKIFITQMTMVTLTAPDKPFAFAAGHEKKVRFFSCASHELGRTYVTTTRDPSIPLRDGQADVSDSEWALLERILHVESPSHNPDVRSDWNNRRDLLDGVLRKECFGTSWEKTGYKTGNFRLASSAKYRWKKRGVWQQMCDVLRMTRA